MNHYKGGGRGGLHEHIKQLKNGIFIKEGCPDYSVHLLPQMYQNSALWYSMNLPVQISVVFMKSSVTEPCGSP